MPNLKIIDFSIDLFDQHAARFLEIAEDIPGEYWAEENFKQHLPEKWKLSFALILKGLPVGYAIASRKSESDVHLHHFMVHRDWRGNACGGMMLQELEKRARASGAARLTLKVMTGSDAAKQFYTRHGCQLYECGKKYDLFEKAL